MRSQEKGIGSALVVVESLYSMDGHCAPIQAMLDCCLAHGALLIVDEAHGTGVFGCRGEGLVHMLGLQSAFCSALCFLFFDILCSSA